MTEVAGIIIVFIFGCLVGYFIGRDVGFIRGKFEK